MANIQDIRAVNNPQRNYEYEVELIASVAGGAFEVMTQRVQTAAIPEKTVETIEINFKGNKTFYSGRDGSGHTLTVSFWEDESNSVRKYFDNWLETGILNTGAGGGLTRDLYQAQLRIKLFAHDSETVTTSYLHTNVFPTSIGETSLNYESSEHATVDITFQFDRQIVE